MKPRKTPKDTPAAPEGTKTPRKRKNRATGQEARPGDVMWAVMKAHAWDAMTCNGWPVACPPEGPHRFIPVFNTRSQAVAWAGSDKHVVAMETI